ncbi:hypothetical protein [Rhodanobacter sp. BL-MT-08]
MTDPDDRFGMPESAFQAAKESHGLNSPVIREGMYVPCRKEVATMPGALLAAILIDWMWESPSELIPNNHQIEQVRAILIARPDANSDVITALIRECDDYLKI